MTYKHILIAVDLSPESRLLVKKAVSLARPYDARISLIHVDVGPTDIYTGLMNANLGYTQEYVSQKIQQALKILADSAQYPVSEMLAGKGDFARILEDAVKEHGVDLVVCGHHQDFWSKLVSSARQLISKVHTDMLIVPLREDNDV
ncbi:universal stress protein UspA [[Erwinia] mediterraneensis]|uniref:universal stress protein UspA n=1 Tax=[Erwinia] mediterraneensis TaxID=2161819 RepID=UPI00102F5688|nr:universal stress protein UspA [[Erwinia] mediterraneensis]